MPGACYGRRQVGLDRVRARAQQFHHHHAHGIDVADGRAGSVPLRGRLSSSQPHYTCHPHSLAPRVASLSRTRLAVASVVAASVVLCSPNYFLYGPKSLSDRPGFWIDYNAIVVDEHKVTCLRLLPATTEQYGGDDIAISLL